jgi:hypothetical protein
MRASAFRKWASLVIAVGLLLAIGIWHWTALWQNYNVSSEVAEVQILTAIEPASDDCQWYREQSQHTHANSCLAGDVIRVTQGKLELEYSHGTKVALHSPAAYQLLSEMKAKIHLGRLSATVTDAAKGFSVAAPRATVIDLGTQFGIEVNNNGATDVIVFKGDNTREFQLNRKSICYTTDMNRTRLDYCTKSDNRKLRWHRCQRAAHSPKSSRLILKNFFHNYRSCGRKARPDLAHPPVPVLYLRKSILRLGTGISDIG